LSADIVTKSAFASLTRVAPSRVSQWIAGGKIYGDALVGQGHRARIRMSVALEQLKRSLDVSQRISANAKAQLELPAEGNKSAGFPPAEQTIDDKLKRERLEQLELANERAREERAARAGIYLNAEDARRQMGRAAGSLLTAFDGALGEFATAIAAQSNLTSRDALHLLRTTWRSIRERTSDQELRMAATLPALVADGADNEEQPPVLSEETTAPPISDAMVQ
jgi:hypothetical protein